VQLEQDLQILVVMMPHYVIPTGSVEASALAAYAASLRGFINTTPPDHRTRVLLLPDVGMLEQLQESVTRFRVKLLPRAFVIILSLLGWLSLTGIVWPLSALPGFPYRFPKPVMLIALVVGLFGLLGYFGYQLIQLTRLGRLSWERRA
jgi:hypothetical protein